MALRVLPVITWYNKSQSELVITFPLGSEPASPPKLELTQARLLRISVDCPGREYRDSIKLRGPILTVTHRVERTKSPEAKPIVVAVLLKPASNKQRWENLCADEKPNITRDWDTEDQVWPFDEEETNGDSNQQAEEPTKDNIFWMRKLDDKELETLGITITKPKQKISNPPPGGDPKNPEYIQKLTELDLDKHLLDDHIPKESKKRNENDDFQSSDSDDFMPVKGGDFVSEVTGLKPTLPEDCDDMPPLEPKCIDKPGVLTEVKLDSSGLLKNNSSAGVTRENETNS